MVEPEAREPTAHYILDEGDKIWLKEFLGELQIFTEDAEIYYPYLEKILQIIAEKAVRHGMEIGYTLVAKRPRINPSNQILDSAELVHPSSTYRLAILEYERLRKGGKSESELTTEEVQLIDGVAALFESSTPNIPSLDQLIEEQASQTPPPPQE